MDKSRRNRLFIQALTWLAGAMDTATGLLLILAPHFTLDLMQVPMEENSGALLGFIGAFVLANGSLYLWAWGISQHKSSWSVLSHAWLATAWIRLCVGITTTIFIMNGKLPPAWATVPASDLLLAGVQFYWIAAGRFPEDD